MVNCCPQWGAAFSLTVNLPSSCPAAKRSGRKAAAQKRRHPRSNFHEYASAYWAQQEDVKLNQTR